MEMKLARFSTPLRHLFLLLACGLMALPARAEVRLPNIFSSHMVLQRDMPIQIWGSAQPNESITITLGSSAAQATANDRGEWRATLPAMPAGGPFVLKVAGSSEVVFDDVMIGEVWLCSGQSNMEMGIGMIRDSQREIAEADHPGLRLFLNKREWSATPKQNVNGAWVRCTPQTVADGGWDGFSAAAYFFGRKLHQELGVTIGLIESSWGGTRIESWTPPRGFASVPALRNEFEAVEMGDPKTERHEKLLRETLDSIERWLHEARRALEEKTLVPPMPPYPNELLAPHDVQNATALYNGAIHPLAPFAIRGALWYQGESNLGEGMRYAEHMKALVGGWREIWHEGEFPFYFVQIAPYNYGANPEAEPELWEAQAAAAQSIPNCGMAVINDVGDLRDIHPKNKQAVGNRLALLALAKTYGRSDVECSGPVYRSMEVEGGKLRLHFDHAGAGLSTRDGKAPDWFEIVDAEEGGFVKADAVIEGASIVLSSPEVRNPVAARFAWSMLAEPNLLNGARLPASAFRAGSIPRRDYLATRVPEAKEYTLVYDLNIAKAGHDIYYDVDNHNSITSRFDRIAYCLELQKSTGQSEFVFVSMDAFTPDLAKIGVPSIQSGAFFQENVKHMNVVSNVRGLEEGRDLPGGNIEFWPYNYGPANKAGVPNASNDIYDFGDEPVPPAEGYGSMQIHNHDARQTLLAFNHWSEGPRADVGIGNRDHDAPDWTFAGNADTYSFKRLRVLVRCQPRAPE